MSITLWNALQLDVSFVITPLGHRVPVNDWKTYHSDAIMKALYGVATSPFNPHNDPLAADDLLPVTGLAPADLDFLINTLESGGLVEVVLKSPDNDLKFVKISQHGIDSVSHYLTLMEQNRSFG